VRILAISTAIPFPPLSGGKLRTCHLLRALSGSHTLTLVGFTYGEQPSPPSYPVRVVGVPWEPPPLYRQMHEGDAALAQRAADQLGGQTAEPWCVSWAESAAMADRLRHLAREPFDLVLLAGTPMARYLSVLPAETPKVLDFMDVYTRMALRQMSIKQGQEAEAATREAERTRRFERVAALGCDQCLAVSEDEASSARELLGTAQVEVVPNGVDTSFFCPTNHEPDRAFLLFTGTMSYRPNAEAVRYFAASILPLVLRDMPNVQLHVVGDAPPKEVTALAGPNIVVHGFVPDMREYHRQAAVVVVPLQRGGGTKLKILEAASMGKAIVTTSVGVDGLPFQNGNELIVADAPEAFARAVTMLAHNREQQRILGARARRLSLQYDWRTIGERFCQIIERVGIRAGARCSGLHSDICQFSKEGDTLT
jgi:glycosyltransferase involved in cell wall biosynthesis